MGKAAKFDGNFSAGPQTIGKIARAAGVHIETIRYYERRGLIPCPKARKGAFRVYHPNTVTRIQNIKRAQSLGFTLEEIRTLLNIGLEQLPQRKDVHDMIQRRTEEMKKSIKELHAMKRFLQSLKRKNFLRSKSLDGVETPSLLECCLGGGK